VPQTGGLEPPGQRLLAAAEVRATAAEAEVEAIRSDVLALLVQITDRLRAKRRS
jgi:hypothetical protein